MFPFILIAENTVYTVKRGETLESIAKSFNITVEDLLKQNPDAAKYFYTGLKLEIPSPTSETKHTMDISQASATNSSLGTHENVSNGINPIEAKSTDNKILVSEDEKKRETSMGFTQFRWLIDPEGKGSFKDKSMYGISVSLFSNVSQRLLLGGTVQFRTNLGLVPTDYASYMSSIELGPCISFTKNNSFFATIPLGVSISVFDSMDVETGKSHVKTKCVFSFTPSINFSFEKVVLTFGVPVLCDKKTSYGLELGLGFRY